MNILNDLEKDRSLSEEGYIVVPFLDKCEVEELKNFFVEHHKEDPQSFYATAHVQDISFRKLMNNKINQVFKKAIQENFSSNTEALGGSFVVKPKSQNNEEKLNPHQDWNIVDEKKYRSFNIWVPLLDLNDKNGAIKVLPKSHLWGDFYRGPNIPDIFSNVHESLWNSMKSLFIKSGHALIYDHRLFHASEPNKTNELRLAAVFGIKPSAADMYYYFGKNGKVEVYNSNVKFFLEGDIQKGPEILEKIDTVEWDSENITEKQLNRFKGKPTFMQKILQKIKLF